MTPREFFPLMPDEVFDAWIAPLIEVKGWPFLSLDDNLSATEWRYLLGLQATLKQWSSAKWELQSIKLTDVTFARGSLEMVEGIVAHAVTDVQTATSNLLNTKQRFNDCAAYVGTHGTVPKPLVFLRYENGFKIFDGHHRLAAYIFYHAHVKTPPSEMQPIPAWVTELL